MAAISEIPFAFNLAAFPLCVTDCCTNLKLSDQVIRFLDVAIRSRCEVMEVSGLVKEFFQKSESRRG